MFFETKVWKKLPEQEYWTKTILWIKKKLIILEDIGNKVSGKGSLNLLAHPSGQDQYSEAIFTDEAKLRMSAQCVIPSIRITRLKISIPLSHNPECFTNKLYGDQ